MDETKSISTATDVVTLPSLPRERRRSVQPHDDKYVLEHLNDPNFDLRAPSRVSDAESYGTKNQYSQYSGASDVETASQERSLSRAESRDSTAIAFDDESPYPEVRAAVANIDDPSMPVNTFRTWSLGIFFTILVSLVNHGFSFRYPSIWITGIVVQLVALPLGKLMERILPTTRFRLFGRVWSLNPGPFNIKEHVCITVMANVVVGGSYASAIPSSQQVFYNQFPPFSYQILLVLSIQILGFSLGGLLRQFVVWPASMIWPGALVNAALFNTLHRNFGKHEHGHMSRERFFCYATICSFIWYWFPGYLFTALSMFNWVCWIAPNNIAVNVLFGVSSGLGMGIFTFDWAMISFSGNPLVTPWWSELNTTAALILFFYIIAPILYFTNTLYAKYMPISAYLSFDNRGHIYNASAIFTNGRFDLAKYESYSPLFITTTEFIAIGLGLASFTSIIPHTFLWFRRDIARRFRLSLRDERDVHSRLMQAYPEVPKWWYAGVGVISLVFLVIAIHLFPTELPVWAALFAFALSIIFAVPVSMVQAIANQQIQLNFLYEMIAGFILPGRPVANMIFKAVSYVSTTQAISFTSDLKLGHYMKVPPRMMFMCQIVSAFISAFVCVWQQMWMFNHIVNFCHRNQVNGFVCPATGTFGTASLIWGGIGPKRMFGVGGIYSSVWWFILIGALLPFPFYFLARRFPFSFWRYVNIPVFFAGVGGIPPGSGINYSSWAITGFIFNYVIRRYHFRWWMRYNYILSAALSAGISICLIIIFFGLQYPHGGITVKWWGNTVWKNTADAKGLPLIALQAGQKFGPTSWH